MCTLHLLRRRSHHFPSFGLLLPTLLPRSHLPHHSDNKWYRNARKQRGIHRIFVFRGEIQEGQHAGVEERARGEREGLRCVQEGGGGCVVGGCVRL